MNEMQNIHSLEDRQLEFALWWQFITAIDLLSLQMLQQWYQDSPAYIAFREATDTFISVPLEYDTHTNGG